MQLPIRSTRYLGPVPHPSTERWHVFGQDGGQTIVAGRSTLIVFSDSLIIPAHASAFVSGQAVSLDTPLRGRGIFLPNCAGITDATTLPSAMARLRYFEDDSGLPRPILQANRQETAFRLRFWPCHGIYLNGQIFLYYLGIQTTNPHSMWGFRTLGTGLAIVDPDSGTCERLMHDGDWCLWKKRADDFHFGVQVIDDGDFLCVFASVRTGLSNTVLLARVAHDSIADPRAYAYLSSHKPTWTPRLQDAMHLGPCSSEYSVSYNAFWGRYLMVYIDEYSKILVMRTAPALWGPYSAPQAIATVPHQASSELVYLGFEHPVFAQDGGQRVFISYCQPNFTANSIVTVNFDGIR